MSDESQRDQRFRAKHVPYFLDYFDERVKNYIPLAPHAYPTVGDVRAFSRMSRKNPGLGLDTLSHLRSTANDRASTLTGLSGVLLSFFGLLFTAMLSIALSQEGEILRAVSYVGAGVSIVALLLTVNFITSLIAQVSRRSTVSNIWLRAYEHDVRK